MHRGVYTCPAHLRLPEAARLMTERKVRALVVTDEACGLVGLVSQSDLVNAAVQHGMGNAWRSLTVADVMTRAVITITADAPITEAARIMVAHRIHRLVVVADHDPCQPIGVLSMGDLVRFMMQE
ncbi:MAG: CBS domain-containing protein [Anaerolineae bacterium]|nr:CBS domain-containing protein [Anaerolineae bacterium]MDW8291550.1 CBS domain-containing protein [Anaerolineae bacterium]